MEAEAQRRWLVQAAEEISRHAERELEALVGVSSPSGDSAGAEEAAAIVAALLPSEVDVERVRCSSPDHAPDLLARLRGGGRARVVLLGHLDTVIGHDEHRPLERDGDRLVGSGSVDMKGGVVLAVGVLRRLAEMRERFAEVALLLVNDEEWRTCGFVHGRRFEGWDGCLCFEAGERGRGGEEGVIVRRKAASTLRIRASGRAAHSGAAPDQGRNALLALARVAGRIAEAHDPGGPQRLSAVPTVLRAGDAFNVVPSAGELLCDLRANGLAAIDRVAEDVPAELDGVSLSCGFARRWPGMDTGQRAHEVLEGAAALLGRPVVGLERGGASDASHLAPWVSICIDGLGPRGGRAHNPDEFVLADSLHHRAEVALAVTAALLDR